MTRNIRWGTNVKELNVLVVSDCTSEWPGESEENEVFLDAREELKARDVVLLSINSVVGLSNPKMMKVKGQIAKRDVVVLIDSRASHNFISTDVVMELDLPKVGTTGCGVLMGTGLTIKGEGMCKGVVLSLQNIEIVVDFLPLELGSADVISGMQWLETLDGMQVNWKTITMKFRIGGTAVTLQGDPILSSSSVSLKAMLKTLKKDKEGMWVKLGSLETGGVRFLPLFKRFCSVLLEYLSGQEGSTL